MSATVFFSWQSDTPRRIGHTFIHQAIELAIEQLKSELAIEDANREEGHEHDLEIDSDTKNVPGSPEIVATVFKKIDAACAFVADVTFVGTRKENDQTPNPNVLIEYGWALKSLSHSRVITVMNTFYGKPSPVTLPFDMRHVRFPIQFELASDASAQKIEKQRAVLANTLCSAIRDIINLPENAELSQPLLAFPAKPSGQSRGRFRNLNEPIGFAEQHWRPDNHSSVFLEAGPVIWMRLMPRNALHRQFLSTDLRRAAVTSSGLLRPLGVGDVPASIGFMRAADGVGTYVNMESSKTKWTTFAFDTGEVWGVDAFSMTAVTNNICLDEAEFGMSMDNYSNFLRELGIDPPYRWIAGIEGTKGRPMATQTGRTYSIRGMCHADSIYTEGQKLVEQSGREALKPLFLKIFDCCGLEPPSELR